MKYNLKKLELSKQDILKMIDKAIDNNFPKNNVINNFSFSDNNKVGVKITSSSGLIDTHIFIKINDLDIMIDKDIIIIFDYLNSYDNNEKTFQELSKKIKNKLWK